MHSLWPDYGEVDPLVSYLDAARPAPTGRPWVALGMVTSIDGATALEGRSGGLGGPADQAVFRAVRAIADVILVGAGTVVAERYGPVTLSDRARAARVDAGRSPQPARLAIVSASLDLDPTDRLFAAAPAPPLVLTTDDAPDERVAALAGVAEVRRAGTGRVDVAQALATLADDGASIVVSEGGPMLNGALAATGIVDELCVTISPVVAGGDSARMVAGAPGARRGFELVSLLTADGMLFGRWVRAAGTHDT